LNESRLHKARRTRAEIAETFTAVSNDQISAQEILESPRDCLGRIRVYDVLRRIPHLNRDGAETILVRARVWPLTTMSELTELERQRIINELPPRVKR
jgi:hypothetical protein